MGWLAAAIFGVAVLYFGIHHPGFRKLALILLTVIVAAAVLGGGYFYWDAQRQAARSAYAKSLISPDTIDFVDLRLSSSYGTHNVHGKVRNRSMYQLRSFKMKITVQDCPAGKCETIGEDEISEYIDVPPGQMRAFDRYVSLMGMPTPIALEWHYSIIELEAALE